MRRLSLGLALVALATPCNAQPPLTAQADRSSVDTLAAAVGAQVRAALAEHAGGDLAIDASIELPPQAPRAGALLDALIEPWLAVLIG
ncbi:MAG: hypothetical protein IT378_17505 [Sandaracinaceae bacterium]|nr:hypothetical protein [Sandaracinaceae bacterium]